MSCATLTVGADYAAALARSPSWLILPVWGDARPGPDPSVPVDAGWTAWRATSRAPWRITRGPPPRALARTPKTGARLLVREPWRVLTSLGTNVLVRYADGEDLWRVSHWRAARTAQDDQQPGSSMPPELGRRCFVIRAQGAALGGDIDDRTLAGCGLPCGAAPGAFLPPRTVADGLLKPTPEVSAREALARWWPRWWPKAGVWSPAGWYWVAQIEEVAATTHAR